MTTNEKQIAVAEKVLGWKKCQCDEPECAAWYDVSGDVQPQFPPLDFNFIHLVFDKLTNDQLREVNFYLNEIYSGTALAHCRANPVLWLEAICKALSL